MTQAPLPKTNVLKRLFCRSMSPPPADATCFRRDGQVVVVDLAKAPELALIGGALRLEGPPLADRLLVVHGVDDAFHAYPNHCACGGFRVDPVPGERKIRCTTLAQSTYDYDGTYLSGPAKKPLPTLPVIREGETLRIDLGQSPVVTPSQ